MPLAIDRKNPIKNYNPLSIEELEQEHMDAADNTEFVLNEDGSVTVDLDVEYEEEESDEYMSNDHYRNLVAEIDEEVLAGLGVKVCDAVEADEASRSDWMDQIQFGLDLIGTKIEEKSIPFEGACSAQHPLLMESAVKFQSKSSNELLPAEGPVKTKILGEATPEREEQANRVKDHMNYTITEKMTEFYPDSERMLLYVPLVGSGFKKTYYDVHLERPVSEFVPADQFIVPNNASDLYRSPRYTHKLYKTEYDLEADCAAGIYEKPEDGLGTPSQPKMSSVERKTQDLLGVRHSNGEDSEVFTLYEQHVECHIEGLDPFEDDPEGDYCRASPYIITVDAGTSKVLGVRRNWRPDDSKRRKKVCFTHYGFVPSFGFYHFGFLHLLGNLQLSLTAALRSLVDAGQFANLQGGFKLKGVRIVDDGSPIVPGQFKEIEAAVMDINKAIMPLPFKGADQTLFAMLDFLDKKGQKFADSTEQVIADATNYGPVGTTMALLDASTKFFSAIHKRLHSALKHELRLIAEINSETLDDQVDYNLENRVMNITREDYDEHVGIVPVSDPNISSNAHRMTKAQALLEMAMRAPEVHDMREVLKHVYINMNYPNIDKILPPPEEAQQNDPITDIQQATQGKPIKAFPGQDHKAHIALKQAFLQDPLSGANVMLQKAAIAIQANIQEHMVLSFIEQTQAQSQITGATQEQAAVQVAQMNQQKLIQEQEQQKQDSQGQAALLLAQAELMDTQTQARKQQFDEKFKKADLELKKEKLDMELIKEIRRAEEFDKTIAADMQKIVQTKGLDAMIAGLSANAAAKREVDKPKKDD